MIVVDAVYIHESGGKTLLEYFVSGMIERKKDFILVLDNRIQSDVFNKIDSNNIQRLNSSEKERRIFYKVNESRINTVLCFANVPPPRLHKHIKVWILFHNSLILSGLFENNSYSFKTKILFFLRRIYIQYQNSRRYRWIVQTNNMKEKLQKGLNIENDSILVMPFFANDFSNQDRHLNAGLPTFLYVADGVKQKNHEKLFEAWKILYDEYDLPLELNVTVPPRFSKLIHKIDELVIFGLFIKNHGVCSKVKLRKLYNDSSFLIFPSLTESFGLPLLEAAKAGCKVIASDLPYVYDVIRPTATFNPHSAKDIAKTIAEICDSESTKKTEIIIDDNLDQLINLIYKN